MNFARLLYDCSLLWLLDYIFEGEIENVEYETYDVIFITQYRNVVEHSFSRIQFGFLRVRFFLIVIFVRLEYRFRLSFGISWRNPVRVGSCFTGVLQNRFTRVLLVTDSRFLGYTQISNDKRWKCAPRRRNSTTRSLKSQKNKIQEFNHKCSIN